MKTALMIVIGIVAFGLLFYWQKKWKTKRISKKEAKEMADYDIRTFNQSGRETFDTTEKTFRYLGYTDIGMGRFTVTAPSIEGTVIFIPIPLKVAVPYYRFKSPVMLRNVAITDNVISGEVAFGLGAPQVVYNEKYVRIYYGGWY